MNKKALYESIMKNVAKEVKKAINEASFDALKNGDHSRVQIVQIKDLQDKLLEKGYKCSILSPSYRQLKNTSADMIVRREDGQAKYVKVIRRKRTTDSGNVLIRIGKYDNSTVVFDDPTINEICIVCPPALNYDPTGEIVDNTKACFFDVDYILNAYVNNELKDMKNRDGVNIVVPERWAKAHAKEIIKYTYTR